MTARDSFSALAEAARSYRVRGAADPTEAVARERVEKLASDYLQRGEKSLLAAASEALRLNRLLRSFPFDPSTLDDDEVRAFHLAFPEGNVEHLPARPKSALESRLGRWKATRFEISVVQHLENDEVVGPVRLGPGQRAALVPEKEGDWKVCIVDREGSVVPDRQELAEEVLAPVKRAIERFPDLKVLTTIDATEQIGHIIDRASGEKELAEQLLGALGEIMENPIHKLASWAAPALPFLVITAEEGHRVLAGRTGMIDAMGSAARRAAGPGIPLAVAGALLLMGAGLLALPAAWGTSLGVGRIERAGLLVQRIRQAEQQLERVHGSRQTPALLAPPHT